MAGRRQQLNRAAIYTGDGSAVVSLSDSTLSLSRESPLFRLGPLVSQSGREFDRVAKCRPYYPTYRIGRINSDQIVNGMPVVFMVTSTRIDAIPKLL